MSIKLDWQNQNNSENIFNLVHIGEITEIYIKNNKISKKFL